MYESLSVSQRLVDLVLGVFRFLFVVFDRKVNTDHEDHQTQQEHDKWRQDLLLLRRAAEINDREHHSNKNGDIVILFRKEYPPGGSYPAP